MAWDPLKKNLWGPRILFYKHGNNFTKMCIKQAIILHCFCQRRKNRSVEIDHLGREKYCMYGTVPCHNK